MVLLLYVTEHDLEKNPKLIGFHPRAQQACHEKQIIPLGCNQGGMLDDNMGWQCLLP